MTKEGAVFDNNSGHSRASSVQTSVSAPTVISSLGESTPLIPRPRPLYSLINNAFVFLLVLLLVVGLFSGLYVIYFDEQGLPIPDAVYVVPRNAWTQIPLNSSMPELEVPVNKVLIVETGTADCSTANECTEIIRKLQREHARRFRHTTLDYNFIIGGDRRTYEERGFGYSVSRDQSDRRTLTIGLIGKFEDKYPSSAQLMQLRGLLDIAVQRKQVTPCYVVLTKKSSNRNPSYLILVAGELQTRNSLC